jgi:hypothetical protein
MHRPKNTGLEEAMRSPDGGTMLLLQQCDKPPHRTVNR